MAQDSSDTASRTSTRATSTSTRPPSTHTVLVGKADHVFEPNNLEAAVGDTVVFEFYPLNHSVVRADYRYPCVPYEDTGSNRRGFFSGFLPVGRISNDMPQWNITINNTQPIFYYCSAPGSCINYGMVGAINPNTSAQVSEQQNLARAANYMLQPGEPFPAEASSSISSIAATSTPTSPPTTSSPSPSPTPAPAPSGLSKGAIAGIAVGAVFALALLGALFYFIGRSRSLKQNLSMARSTVPHNPETGYNPAGRALFSSYGGSHSGAASDAGAGSGYAASAVGRWSSQQASTLQGSSGYASGLDRDREREVKDGLARGYVDEVGSVRSTSPPVTNLSTPALGAANGFMPFPAGAGMPPAVTAGQGWYFDASGQATPTMPGLGLQGQAGTVAPGHGSVELRGSEVGMMIERGQEGGRVHELEAQRGSGVNHDGRS
ncbi:Hypothetical protein D9617_5g069620 [Elsinoe fawcettii]|nr:Hypothetical protein D9617_5g069620 [Elsinoe fawcettii]